MAISDIPEFVEVAPGDLIRADSWNTLQRQLRNSLRTHQHTRVPGSPANDADTSDVADQIETSEIADGAVTAAKLAAGAITSTAIPDGAITMPKLADGAVGGTKIADSGVTTAKLQNNCVTSNKLAFTTVKAGSNFVGPGQTAEGVVQQAAPTTKTTIYFPLLTIVGSTGQGTSDVEANIVYQQLVGAQTVDVFIRLVNHGPTTAQVLWQVMTFASGS